MMAEDYQAAMRAWEEVQKEVGRDKVRQFCRQKVINVYRKLPNHIGEAVQAQP